ERQNWEFRLKALQDTLDAVEQERDGWRRRVGELTESIEAKSRENNEKIAALERALHDTSASDAAARFEELEKQITETTAEMEMAKDRVRALERQIRDAEVERAQRVLDLEDALSAVAQERESLEDRVNGLLYNIEQAEEKQAAMGRKILELEKSIKSLEEEKDEVAAALADAEQALVEANAERDEMKVHVTSLETELKICRSDAAEAARMAEVNLNRVKTEADTTIARIRQELAEAGSAASLTRMSMAKITRGLADGSGDSDDSVDEDDTDAQDRVRAMYDHEVSKLRAELAEANSELVVMKARLAQVPATEDITSKGLSLFEGSSDEAKNVSSEEVEKLKSELQSKTQECETLKASLQEMEQKLESANRAAAKSSNDISDLRKDLEEAEERERTLEIARQAIIEASDEAATTARHEIEAARDEIDSLQTQLKEQKDAAAEAKRLQQVAEEELSRKNADLTSAMDETFKQKLDAAAETEKSLLERIAQVEEQSRLATESLVQQLQEKEEDTKELRDTLVTRLRNQEGEAADMRSLIGQLKKDNGDLNAKIKEVEEKAKNEAMLASQTEAATNHTIEALKEQLAAALAEVETLKRQPPVQVVEAIPVVTVPPPGNLVPASVPAPVVTSTTTLAPAGSESSLDSNGTPVYVTPTTLATPPRGSVPDISNADKKSGGFLSSLFGGKKPVQPAAPVASGTPADQQLQAPVADVSAAVIAPNPVVVALAPPPPPDMSPQVLALVPPPPPVSTPIAAPVVGASVPVAPQFAAPTGMVMVPAPVMNAPIPIAVQQIIPMQPTPVQQVPMQMAAPVMAATVQSEIVVSTPPPQVVMAPSTGDLPVYVAPVAPTDPVVAASPVPTQAAADGSVAAPVATDQTKKEGWFLFGGRIEMPTQIGVVKVKQDLSEGGVKSPPIQSLPLTASKIQPLTSYKNRPNPQRMFRLTLPNRSAYIFTCQSNTEAANWIVSIDSESHSAAECRIMRLEAEIRALRLRMSQSVGGWNSNGRNAIPLDLKKMVAWLSTEAEAKEEEIKACWIAMKTAMDEDGNSVSGSSERRLRKRVEGFAYPPSAASSYRSSSISEDADTTMSSAWESMSCRSGVSMQSSSRHSQYSSYSHHSHIAGGGRPSSMYARQPSITSSVPVARYPRMAISMDGNLVVGVGGVDSAGNRMSRSSVSTVNGGGGVGEWSGEISNYMIMNQPVSVGMRSNFQLQQRAVSYSQGATPFSGVGGEDMMLEGVLPGAAGKPLLRSGGSLGGKPFVPRAVDVDSDSRRSSSATMMLDGEGSVPGSGVLQHVYGPVPMGAITGRRIVSEPAAIRPPQL
ncbi:hypothetical protein HDU76_013459, partial [Blyttiomyces sp. JEL0837]